MSIDTNYRVLRHVLDEYEPDGWAIEFGVYTGYSLNIIAAHMPVIGLDSFEGLPEDWRPGFPKGRFGDNNVLRHLPAFANNVMLLHGAFDQSVPRLQRHGMPIHFGLVHIDCDLYSSTVTALEGMRHHIGHGTIVVFDEYQGYPGHEEHEMKAWEEFTTKYGIDYTLIAEGPEEAAFRIEISE